MSDVVIEAQGLGKRYALGTGGGYRRFSEVLAQSWRRLMLPRAKPLTQEFWALSEVDFELRRGEVLGIIGRNGAGKSTLLKILSRITEPTTGRLAITGRVASLLEVGTGFHPELSGRENIYLNGAILGMSRAEIRAKFDEIVAFAEVEKFLDLPVKRYSSGMYVRLAFAVAAHLEPEILIVDEVLAVGDAAFQAKCLGKMRDVASGGRTVLFVSHHLAALRSMCSRALVLERGRVVANDSCSRALEYYQGLILSDRRAEGAPMDQRLDDAAKVVRLQWLPRAVTSMQAAQVELEIEMLAEDTVLEVALIISNSAGQRCAVVDLRRAAGAINLVAGQRLVYEAQIDSLPLVEGDYELGLYYFSTRGRVTLSQLAPFSVLPLAVEGPAPFIAQDRGICELRYECSRRAC